MPTAAENQRPTPLSPLERLVVRRPVAAFLLTLYAIAWSVFLPVVLQARGLLALPVDLSEGFAFDAVTSIASILGVALPAFIVTAAISGKAGVRDLLGRCVRWRVGIVWYLAALLGLLAVMVLAASRRHDGTRRVERPKRGATTNLLIAARVPTQSDLVPPTEKGDSA